MDLISQISTDTSLKIIIAVVAIVVIAIIATLLGRSRRPARDLILLLGQCGAGKTTLFYHWSNKGMKNIKTVTSQNPNRGFVLEDIKHEVIDYPGHPRLRSGAFNLMPRADKVVYLIDSTDKGSLKSVAENLFDIFAFKDLSNKTRMMLCFNKSDLTTAMKYEEILTVINQEIESLRKSRSDEFVGIEGESFDILTHAPVSVTLGTSSVIKRDLESIDQFLH
jgi:signal recognition particle receptor subunit beta